MKIHLHRRHLLVTALTLALLAAGTPAFAQEPERPSGVAHLVTGVLLDPTTYAPTMVAWTATRLDWSSSQVFFQNGWVEQNERFTVSGVGNGTAIDYAAGNRRILADAFGNLQLSLVNNLSTRIVEQVLMPRYPDHRRLIRAVGWIERSGMASLLSYKLSAGHFRQWQENGRRSQQLGY
jgi:hypothetical protein